MATSEAKVCNIALRQLRAARIEDLAATSEEGQLCAELFDDARDFVMKLRPWKFAKRRQTLATVSPAPAFGFTFAFQLPTDPRYLRALKLNGSEDEFAQDGDDFKIEGSQLLTDASPADLLFLAKITDVSAWSPEFVQALAAYLKHQMAYTLTGSATVQQIATDQWEKMLRKAGALDQAEDTPDNIALSPFVAVRS